ncbi:hypothetical protein [uncultured Bacteroides sp.]|uniref:hypothetical protein n=1 Tax=uncultured Bacteroides sp. TaxID=162156 RepID=UPI0025F88AFF|nr:hypothetical protein [uncultured Bacteroides sp.]
MLTQLTQTAIAVLYDIYAGGKPYRTAQLTIAPQELIDILTKFEMARLVRRKEVPSSGLLASYELTCSYTDISLLNILEALDEHLNCNHPTKEKMYLQYRAAAHRLGVINQMTRLYLSEIKLIDL